MRREATVEELARLYRERYGAFVHVASVIAGDEGRGADAVQEAFAAAIRARASYRREAPLEAWVWRIVVRAAAEERPGREQPSGVAEDLRSAGTGNGGGSFDGGGLRALVAALPERQRLAVFLRYFADLDYRSIAQVLGVEVGTVSATLNAARASLLRMLQEAR